MHPLFSEVADYLFPPRCFLCKEEGRALCLTCVTRLGRAVESSSSYTTSVFDFKDRNVKKIIHAIKYYGRRDLVPALADKSVRELLRFIEHEQVWVLCPIPMPRWRKYMRGYNQADIVAKEISTRTGFPVVPFLIRSKSTLRQARVTKRAERLQAQKASFAIGADPRGAHIILVDDVTTTGATLNEARKTLLAHGAAKVCAITLAH